MRKFKVTRVVEGFRDKTTSGPAPKAPEEPADQGSDDNYTEPKEPVQMRNVEDSIKAIINGDVPVNKPRGKHDPHPGGIQLDKLTAPGDKDFDIYYVAVYDEEDGCADIEGYPVVDKKTGEIFFNDLRTHELIKGNRGGGDFSHGDDLFEVEEEYELESGRAKPGAGKAMRDAIMNS